MVKKNKKITGGWGGGITMTTQGVCYVISEGGGGGITMTTQGVCYVISLLPPSNHAP